MENKKLEHIFLTLAKAGKAIVEVYNSDNFDEQTKSDNSPVTRADKASSKIINAELKKIFPDIPILDEENTIPKFNERKNWLQFFMVDPLDGTKEFIKRNGEFCINLALLKGTSPEYGWIYQPLAQKGWFCKKGSGVLEFDKHGKTTALTTNDTKPEKLRIVASRSFFKPREAELIEKMKQHYHIEIIHCGSSKKQVEMVKGNADMYLKAGPCSEWDTAPGQLMVEEIGGAVLRHDSFDTLQYNREILINPHFVMLNKRLNTPQFIKYLKEVIHN